MAGKKPVHASLAGEVYEMRQRFLRAGHIAEERTLSRAGLIVKEYAERSGQGFIDDVSGTWVPF